MDGSLTFESFLEGAKKAAHKAMDDHGRAEYDEFALHAGVAVEKLAKAVLVSKHPMYIMELRGSTEMLFHIGGHKETSSVRTISAAEAIQRLRTLDVLSADRQVDLLINVRNGIAHTSSSQQAKSLLPTLAETVEQLLADLGGPLNTFWGRWTASARLAVDRKRGKVYRDVQVRISQARHRFDDRFAGLPEGAKDRILKGPHLSEGKMLGPFSRTDGGTTFLMVGSVTCPACNGKASMLLIPTSISDTGATLGPCELHCRLCALELTSLEEIQASGFDTEKAHILLPSVISIDSPTHAVRLGETSQG